MGLLTTVGAVGVSLGEKQISHLQSFSDNSSSAYSITLSSANAPILNSGSGTITDSKGVVWEYHNASNYEGGHVTLNNESYMGISSTSPYGVTQIESICANFNSEDDSEVWLLKSVDGITWGEDCVLTSGSYVTSANDWRYIRLYNYASSVNIYSLTVNYGCSGISATEDVDSAKVSNVISTSSNLSYVAEYNDISPNSIDGEAVKFTKSGSGSTTITLGFGQTFTIGNIQNAKVEFDMNTSNINYGKSICLMMNSTQVGSAIESSKASSYKCTNIEGKWYHIEVPITAFVSTISGYGTKDIPSSDVLTKTIDGIKINAGNCIIDNLRISSSQCELGIFNSPTYKPAVDEYFWLKVSWVGKLYPEQVTMTFSDDTLARRIPLDDPNLKHGSPFYIQLLASGTVTVTCTVVSGYNRSVHTIEHTITVK